MSQVDLEQLKLEEIEWIDAACESFQARWHANPKPSIDEFLIGCPEQLQPPLALELIELELSLRKGAGEAPSLSEYCERYPHWSDAITALEVSSAESADLSSKMLQLPTQIPGYELGAELGRGGMGVVYRALHKGLGRYVALKMATIQSGPSRNEVERFRTEAESAARLHHPNIAQIFEIGSVDNVPFYTMELVEGGNLDQALAKQPLGPASAAELMIFLAQAVAYAHEMGIVHRDLKPSNILLQTRPSSAGSSSFRKDSPQSRAATSTGWVPKITDFGLAKKIDSNVGHTLTGVVVGTPDYISPEQTYGRSDQVGPATDIYALGAILYESLVGRPPFRSANLFETLEQVRFKDPVPPSRLQSSVPRDLETICLKCLEKQPQNRYASAVELAADLERFLHGIPIAARPVSRFEQGLRWSRRNPVLASMITLITILTVAVILLPSWLAIQLNRSLKVSDALAILAAKNERETREHAAAVEDARQATENLNRESQGHLVGMRIAAGDSHNTASNSLRSLLWYAHAWQDDRFASRDDSEHRMRIGQAIRHLPQLIGLCIHEQAIDDFIVDASLTRAVLLDVHHHASLWNPMRGEWLGQFEHGSSVTSVALAEKAQQAITAGETSVRLWDVESIKLAREWATTAEVRSAAVSPDEVWVAAACEDGTIRLWNRETGEDHPRLDTSGLVATTGSIPNWVSFTPDSRAMLVIDDKHRLSVWSVENGTLLTQDLEHVLLPSRKGSLPTFQRDGEWLVTWADKQFSLIDTATWQVVATRKTVANISDFAWDKSFNRMVFATQSSLFRWLSLAGNNRRAFETGALVDTLTPRQTMFCEQSSDGSWAAVSSSGGVVNVYKSEKQELFVRLRVLGEVTQLRFLELKGGTQALAASGGDGTLRMWRLSQPGFANLAVDPETELRGLGEWLERDGQRLTLSPDGDREIALSDRAVRLSARNSREPMVTFEFEGTPQQVSFAHSASRVAVSDSTSCRVLDTSDGSCVGELYHGQANLLKIQLSSDGQRLLTWRAGELASVWDVDRHVKLLGDGCDGTANDFIDQSKGQDIHDVCLTPDGRQLIQHIQHAPSTQVYRVDSGELVAETDVQNGVFTPIALSTATNRFLVGNSDTRARVWDAALGQPVGPLLQHPSFVRLGCVSPDGNLAATYAADGRLRIWNPTRGDLILSDEIGLQRGKIWFGADSRRLFVRRQTGTPHEIIIPRWEGDLSALNDLIQLHSCERIDETQGLADLQVKHFRDNPERFVDAWKSSLGLY